MRSVIVFSIVCCLFIATGILLPGAQNGELRQPAIQHLMKRIGLTLQNDINRNVDPGDTTWHVGKLPGGQYYILVQACDFYVSEFYDNVFSWRDAQLVDVTA